MIIPKYYRLLKIMRFASSPLIAIRASVDMSAIGTTDATIRATGTSPKKKITMASIKMIPIVAFSLILFITAFRRVCLV